MANIGPCFRPVKRGQIKARRNALIQLPELRASQHDRQLGLSGQNNLQQLLFVGLEVGKQSNLLQHLDTEVLRLVDHQHCAPVGAMITQQKLVQGIGEHLQANRAPGVIDIKFIAHRGQQLNGAQGGVENDGDVGAIRQLFKQTAIQRGLPGTHFSRKQR